MNIPRSQRGGFAQGLCVPFLVLAFGVGLPARARGDFWDDLPNSPAARTPEPAKSKVPTPPPAVTPSAGLVLPEGAPSPAPAPGAGVPNAGAPSSSAASTSVPPGSPAPVASPGSGLFNSDISSHDSHAPIQFGGDSVDGSREKGVVIIVGNFELTQGDTTLRSQRGEIHSKPGSQKAERAVAKGKVNITKKASAQAPEIRAVCEELEYFIPERKMLLRGQPRIWKGRELLQGQVMELSLDTSEIRILGARGVFEPEGAATPAARPRK